MADRALAMMACEAFDFHGRSVAVFEHFTATPDEARRLTDTGYAVVRAKRYQTAALQPAVAEPAPVPTTPTKKRRAYRRRDLTAESA